ncbi:MAG: hypothetical protein LC130_25560 [Bryobacterales bacterium]|nr:hypothetical protein [Bryobacterales bacterium]
MAKAERPDRTENRPVQPSLAARGERRRIERQLQKAGILCQPEVSLQYQALAKRSVLRGVESGGATREIGRYVTFCDERGERIAWLQPIDSVAVNGRHAVVIAPALVSVEVFRVRHTYDVLILAHNVVQVADGRRARPEANVLFRGRQGYLPLDLTGDEKNVAGEIVPEFFSKAGELITVPAMFGKALKAAVRGASCVSCTHQHYLRPPEADSIATAATTAGEDVPAAQTKEAVVCDD